MNYNFILRKRIYETFHTQNAFAEAINTNICKVSLVINGRYNLTDEEKERWAEALDCSVDEIFLPITDNEPITL